MSTVIITAGPTGGVKNRLDIRDFIKNEKFFTLYVRSLRELAAVFASHAANVPLTCLCRSTARQRPECQ